MTRLGLGGALLLLATLAHAATCTVSELQVLVRSVDLFGTVAVAGLELPATIDEAAGTFGLDLSGFPNTHFDIVVDNQLDFEPRTYGGTIDAAGNVFLPSVQMNLVTVFGGGGLVVATPDLSTGIASVVVTGRDFATQGTALDFTTGLLVLEGHVPIAAAPGAPGALTVGARLACRLSPIPDRARLPRAGVLTRATGRATLASDGDRLELVAKLAAGAMPLDFARGLFVRLRDANQQDVMLMRADVTPSGRKTTVTDDTEDGNTIRVVGGRRLSGSTLAALGGKVVVKQGKKGLTATISERGLDLAKLAAGNATVTVGVGALTASDTVTVRRTSRKLTFK
jgi:hypothetical protein